MSIESESYMPAEAIHELSESEISKLESNPAKEYPPEIRDILKNINARLKLELLMKNKINEGQQALIFKFDVQKFAEPQESDEIEEDGHINFERYFSETKSIKVLKLTNQSLAANEYKWHDKAYGIMQAETQESQEKYAKIPKPILIHTLEINESIRERLNRQNAEIVSDKASVILMDWVEGEDLLTKLFRLYLKDRPGYESMAENKNVNFASLLISVSSDFRDRGLDFGAMEPLEQYKKLLQAVTKNGHQLLTENQRNKLANTIRLLHSNDIYHNDLHLRNVLVDDEQDGEVYLIDFGRADDRMTPYSNAIDDSMILNLLSQYKLGSEIEKQADFEISTDVKRLMTRDESTKVLISSLTKMSETELIKFMNIDSSQWRYDSWRVRRIVAAAYSLKENKPDRAHLIAEHLKTKRSELQVESVKVIDWLDRQI